MAAWDTSPRWATTEHGSGMGGALGAVAEHAGLAVCELLLSAMLPARALAHRPVDSSPPETSYLVTKNV